MLRLSSGPLQPQPASNPGTNQPSHARLRERAQALQAARDGGGKAALAAQRREQQAVLRPVRLVGAVRAAGQARAG